MCTNRPAVPAAHPGARCGRPFCVDCLDLVDGMPVCKTCSGSVPRQIRWDVVVIGLIVLVALSILILFLIGWQGP
jgi:hypothetical protein